MIEVKDLSLHYNLGGQKVDILKDVHFQVHPGEFIGIQGPSGSGKSTLFYILGLMLRPTKGKVLFDGVDVTHKTPDELAYIRNQQIGFIFQQFHLLPKASVLDNILLPTLYPLERRADPKAARLKALDLAKGLGLENHLDHHPNQLSGGQQQRVAIARALMNDVQLILADEPTGNLDSKNAEHILKLLKELSQQGKTIVMITHDSEVAKHCSKVYHVKDGEIVQVVENNPTQKLREVLHPPAPLPRGSMSEMIFKTFPMVRKNLLRNKAKSLLTMLGVVIGVAAVLAMVTLGQFTKRKILESYESLGVNTLRVRGYPNWNLKATDVFSVAFQSFDWEKDLKPLKRIFPEIQLMSPVIQAYSESVTAGGLSVTEKVSTYGVGPEYLAILSRGVQVGRTMSPFHIENRSPVCLIGMEIATRLFPRTKPLGQIVNISDGRSTSFPCQVIGVLKSLTSNQDANPPNRQVFIPFTYLQIVSKQGIWGQRIYEFATKLRTGTDVEITGNKFKNFFDKKYGKSGMFDVDSDSVLIGQMKKFLNIFTVLLAAIALLSLIVGGIGINNMMLVSVTERIKEFGIRKAMGATNQSIRLLVLMESMGLCLMAGIIGVLVGFVTYELMIFGASKFVPKLQFEWAFEPTAVFLSLISILAVGIASGFIPALKAEKLQVIEALRAE